MMKVVLCWATPRRIGGRLTVESPRSQRGLSMESISSRMECCRRVGHLWKRWEYEKEAPPENTVDTDSSRQSSPDNRSKDRAITFTWQETVAHFFTSSEMGRVGLCCQSLPPELILEIEKLDLFSSIGSPCRVDGD